MYHSHNSSTHAMTHSCMTGLKYMWDMTHPNMKCLIHTCAWRSLTASVTLFYDFALQRTATHCNTFHHTTIHLQHTMCSEGFKGIGHAPLWFHTTTHCNTSQHTATHCNTLQQLTATHYVLGEVYGPWSCASMIWKIRSCHLYESVILHIKLSHVHEYALWSRSSVIWDPLSKYNSLQHITTHCNTLQHIATRCNTRQCIAIHCNTMQHIATHCKIQQPTAKDLRFDSCAILAIFAAFVFFTTSDMFTTYTIDS